MFHWAISINRQTAFGPPCLHRTASFDVLTWPASPASAKSKEGALSTWASSPWDLHMITHISLCRFINDKGWKQILTTLKISILYSKSLIPKKQCPLRDFKIDQPKLRYCDWHLHCSSQRQTQNLAWRCRAQKCQLLTDAPISLSASHSHTCVPIPYPPQDIHIKTLQET